MKLMSSWEGVIIAKINVMLPWSYQNCVPLLKKK